MKSAAPLATADKVDAPATSKGVAMVDNRAAAVAQRQAQAAIDASPRQVAQRQQAEAAAPRKNTTGLPDNLKAGVENLSGYSLDDVKVHYNSSQPAQLQAHAYAQGTDIHVAPGQEQHLPHETWHVVQQKQGRVKPTVQLKGNMNINDDAGLEKEADVMGARSLGLSQQMTESGSEVQVSNIKYVTVAQRVVLDARNKEVPTEHVRIILSLAVREWLTGTVEENVQQRQLWNEVIDKIANKYARKEHRTTVDQLIVELAAKTPAGITPPAFGVNEHSRQEDLKQNIATSDGEELDYHAPTGEDVVAPNGSPVREGLREKDNISELTWVLRKDGIVSVKKRNDGERTPHPTLIGGKSPQVVSGGTVSTNNGLIEEVRDDSGHFQPDKSGVPHALKWMRKNKLPLSENYRGFKTFGTEKGENTVGYGSTFKAQWKQAKSQIDRSLNEQIAAVSNRITSTEVTMARPLPQNAAAKNALITKMLERSEAVLDAAWQCVYQTSNLVEYREANGIAQIQIAWEKAEATISREIRMVKQELTKAEDTRSEKVNALLRPLQVIKSRLELLKDLNNS